MLWDGLAEPRQYSYCTQEFQVGIQNPGKGLLLEKFKSYIAACGFIHSMLAPNGEYRLVRYDVTHCWFEDRNSATQVRTWETIRLPIPEINAPPPDPRV